MSTDPTTGTTVGHPLSEAVLGPHEVLRREMAEARDAATRPGDPRAAFAPCDTFVSTLSEHLAAAEEVLYPAARRRLPDGAKRVSAQLHLIRRMERVLREIEASLYGDSFARGAPRERVWEDMAATLEDYEAAEKEVTKQLDETLDAGAGRKLADRFEAAVLRAPTRPHPYSPHSRVLGGLSNRIWAIADRALDTMDNRTTPQPPPAPHPRADTRWGQYLLGQPMFEEEPAVPPSAAAGPTVGTAAEPPASAPSSALPGMRRRSQRVAVGAVLFLLAGLVVGMGVRRFRR